MNANAFRNHVATTIARTRNALRRRTAHLEVRLRNGGTIAYALRTREFVTITTFLDTIGVDQEFQRRNASQIGKDTANAYRARAKRDNTRPEPLRVWTVSRTHGLPIHVFAYRDGDPILAEGLKTFIHRREAKRRRAARKATVNA
ncbi:MULTISPECIES: hypothetical protein [unclassified Nocardia]|uniref:hypothetical protein n=1 Tax=unclassified Nocardia TaxID=2637762 RepID=UPI00278BAF23|nr:MULTISPECIES: hypothetical protein [unclassified Nocardia]